MNRTRRILGSRSLEAILAAVLLLLGLFGVWVVSQWTELNGGSGDSPMRLFWEWTWSGTLSTAVVALLLAGLLTWGALRRA